MISRLQSAKVSDYELTFGQAEEVAAKTAPLNNKITELGNLVRVLQADLELVQKKTGSIQISKEEQKARTNEINEFRENSMYTALVFHREESQDKGELVVNALLKVGFKSSDARTDFSELKKIRPESGVIYLTYNQAGKVILPKIKSLIQSLVPDVNIKINPRAIGLRRGNVQVLVF